MHFAFGVTTEMTILSVHKHGAQLTTVAYPGGARAPP